MEIEEEVTSKSNSSLNPSIKPMGNFIKSHPISLVSILKSIFIFTVVGFFMAVVARLGFNPEQAANIISENKAPKTLELIGTIALTILLLRAIFKGPAGVPQNTWNNLLLIDLLNAVVSIAAVFFGVSLGSFLGSLGSDLSSQASAELLPSFIILSYLYILFLTLTIDKTTAPYYSKPRFQNVYRILSVSLLFVLFGRTLTLLTAISRGVMM